MKMNLSLSRHLLLWLSAFMLLTVSCSKDDEPKKPVPPAPKNPPVVTTAAISAITQTTATSGGEVTDEGTSPVTARGVCWDSIPGPDIFKSRTTDGTGLGSFVSQLTGLVGGTKYYVRAYAISEVDTVYGAEINFETEPIPFSCGMTVKYEGKNYRTVEIGTQCWFKDNLNVGTYVASTTTTSSHSNVTNNGIIEKYCYDNNQANCDVYGGLYDWDEMMGYSTTAGARGICPEGWHVPTDDEIFILLNYLGGSAVAGGKLKEAGTAHWNSPNIGASNSSGFTALPGGFRSNVGAAQNLTTYGYYWSSTSAATNTAYFVSMYFNSQSTSRNNYDKAHGFSVRCIQN